jgi:disulfide bond formation protein DsbB
MFTSRSFQLLLTFIAFAIIGYAVFLEHHDNLLPCPLCVFQRLAYGLVALGALIAFLGYRFFYARTVGWIFGFVFALAGLSLALRQMWLQYLGPDAITTCVPGLNYLYTNFSWFKATMLVFQGTSDCAKVTWRLLGLTMANWSAIIFALFAFTFLINLIGNKKIISF